MTVVVIVVYDVVGGQLRVVSGEAFQIESRGAEDEIDLRNNKGKNFVRKAGEKHTSEGHFSTAASKEGTKKFSRQKLGGRRFPDFPGTEFMQVAARISMIADVLRKNPREKFGEEKTNTTKRSEVAAESPSASEWDNNCGKNVDL